MNTDGHTPSSHRGAFSIPLTHPSLPGHFPGQPIVPGVLVLDCVIEQAQQWLQRPLRVRALQQAKFVSPLLPEQIADLELTLSGTELRFAVKRETLMVAQGTFALAFEAVP